MSSKHDHAVCIKQLDEFLELMEVGGYQVRRAWIDCVNVRGTHHYWNNSQATFYAEYPSNVESNLGETVAAAKVQDRVPGAEVRPQGLPVEVASKQLVLGFALDAPDARADNRHGGAAVTRRKRLWGGRNPGN